MYAYRRRQGNGIVGGSRGHQSTAVQMKISWKDFSAAFDKPPL